MYCVIYLFIYIYFIFFDVLQWQINVIDWLKLPTNTVFEIHGSIFSWHQTNTAVSNANIVMYECNWWQDQMLNLLLSLCHLRSNMSFNFGWILDSFVPKNSHQIRDFNYKTKILWVKYHSRDFYSNCSIIQA